MYRANTKYFLTQGGICTTFESEERDQDVEEFCVDSLCEIEKWVL